MMSKFFYAIILIAKISADPANCIADTNPITDADNTFIKSVTDTDTPTPILSDCKLTHTISATANDTNPCIVTIECTCSSQRKFFHSESFAITKSDVDSHTTIFQHIPQLTCTDKCFINSNVTVTGNAFKTQVERWDTSNTVLSACTQTREKIDAATNPCKVTVKCNCPGTNSVFVYSETFADVATSDPRSEFTITTTPPLTCTKKCYPDSTTAMVKKDDFITQVTNEDSSHVLSECETTHEKGNESGKPCKVTVKCTCPGMKMFVKSESFTDENPDQGYINAFKETPIVKCKPTPALIALIVVGSIVGLAGIIGLAIFLKKKFLTDGQ